MLEEQQARLEQLRRRRQEVRLAALHGTVESQRVFCVCVYVCRCGVLHACVYVHSRMVVIVGVCAHICNRSICFRGAWADACHHAAWQYVCTAKRKRRPNSMCKCSDSMQRNTPHAASGVINHHGSNQPVFQTFYAVKQQPQASRCASPIALLLLQVKQKHSAKLRAYHQTFHPVWGRLLKTGYQNSRYAHQVGGQLMYIDTCTHVSNHLMTGCA